MLSKYKDYSVGQLTNNTEAIDRQLYIALIVPVLYITPGTRVHDKSIHLKDAQIWWYVVLDQGPSKRAKNSKESFLSGFALRNALLTFV